MQGASPLASPGLGGARHWGRGRTTRPAGGVPGWLPAKPPFSLLFCPLSPAPLPRRGRGRFRLFYARGFAPCIPGAGRGAALGKEASRCPAGACPVGCPLSLPLACFSAPYPPFPGGEGGDFRLFYARGFAPCIPGAEPARHWGRGRTTRPAGGVPGWLPAKPPFSLLFCPHPPVPLPGGKGEIFTLFRRGLPPPAPLRLNLYGAGSTFGKQFLSVMPKTFPRNNIIEESP